MKILTELKGGSTIGGPCPAKNGPLKIVQCGIRIDQARGPDGKLWCTQNGKPSNWCARCGTHVVWEDGGWRVAGRKAKS